MTDKAVDELNELVVAKGLHTNNVEKVSEITMHICCCWRPFSLAKYCAIFSNDKGYFCPIANNNQLGDVFGRNEINNEPAGSFRNVTFSLRI